jgi:hypothetical protein
MGFVLALAIRVGIILRYTIMKARTAKLILIAIAVSVCNESARAIDTEQARAFSGRDFYIAGETSVSFHAEAGIDVLVVEGGFSQTIGADTFGGDRAIIWLKRETQFPSVGNSELNVWAYISGRVSAERTKGTRLPGLNWQMVSGAEEHSGSRQAIIVWFKTSGEVFLTVKDRKLGDVRSGEFYAKAYKAVSAAAQDYTGQMEAVAPIKAEHRTQNTEPGIQNVKEQETSNIERPASSVQQKMQKAKEESGVGGFFSRLIGPPKKKVTRPAARAKSMVRYPVNIAPAGDTEPNIEAGKADGEDIATVIGRFYLWQKQNEQGELLEMQADAAVVFYGKGKKSDDSTKTDESDGIQEMGVKGSIRAVYVCGDVIMTEGLRSIRAGEIYYDFENKTGLAVNTTLRSFDPGRGIPIYVRAAKIRQLAENKFSAQNVVITTSEFAKPQLSLEASNILLVDTTEAQQTGIAEGEVKDSSYDIEMKDVRLKYYDTTLFYWPYMRSNLERPDVPFKSMQIGNDSVFGTSVETKWFLSRLLGLREPQGTDGTYQLDYYSKRGVGTGIDVDYAQEEHLGKIIGYVINDRGKDRLGRVDFRRNIEPPEQTRGRFSWVHREFMPYNWQLTTGINYESDENFIESYYRKEFNTGPERETYVHLKRIEDNWAIAFLGKGKINDFADELEEYPTGEFHLTGQSIFDDKLTLYSDTQGGQYRQRIGDGHNTMINQEPFADATHRTEIDAPVWLNGVKAVPYVAGTVGYDDRNGFNRALVDGSNAGTFNENVVGIGEAGLRLSSEYWNVYRTVQSRLWDIDGLRHIVRPELDTTVYSVSDPTVTQHDVVHIGMSQRLQTKRGPAGEQRRVDWMRLDLGGTWFADNEPRTNGSGPFRYIWNRPMTPLRMFTMPAILNGDLQTNGLKKFETYGPQRDYYSYDYSWQLSDTTAFLSDGYYDIHNGTFEQVNAGFSRQRLPDLSYYIGTRYLANTQILEEHGTNAFVFAASYQVDERYTLVFAQQYDFDYGANVGSDLTIIRRYHRVFWSLTFATDASLDNQAIMFSIWPEGVPELALGSRRYSGLLGPGGY